MTIKQEENKVEETVNEVVEENVNEVAEEVKTDTGETMKEIEQEVKKAPVKKKTTAKKAPAKKKTTTKKAPAKRTVKKEEVKVSEPVRAAVEQTPVTRTIVETNTVSQPAPVYTEYRPVATEMPKKQKFTENPVHAFIRTLCYVAIAAAICFLVFVLYKNIQKLMGDVEVIMNDEKAIVENVNGLIGELDTAVTDITTLTGTLNDNNLSGIITDLHAAITNLNTIITPIASFFGGGE